MANQEVTRKAPIDMLCLSLLCEKDRYGYELSQEIISRSEGKLAIPEAAVYIAMYKMVGKGYATDRREVVGGEKSRIRVYYHITDSGREYLQEARNEFTRMADGVRLFLKKNEQP